MTLFAGSEDSARRPGTATGGDDPVIAITAAATINALGADRHRTLDAMLHGRVGAHPIAGATALEAMPVAPHSAGAAVEIDPPAGVGSDRAERILHRAVVDALAEARLDAAALLRRRAATVVGTTLGGMRHWGAALRSGDPSEVRRVTPAPVLAAALAGTGLPCGGVTISAACASGLSAIIAGAALLRCGEADVVLAGGYDPISEFSLGGFLALRLVAPDAPRPFDAARVGMAVGEGCGLVALERLEDALRRGARVLATLRGAGETSDAHHLTQPHPDGAGAARAMRAALDDAGIDTSDIDLVVAHATATPNNDVAEYRAYRSVFGERLRSVPVVAFKGRLGHTLGAAGAVELVVGIACMERGVAPPTATGDVDRSEFAELDLVTHAARPLDIRRSLHVALGFGGADGCIVTERLDSAPSGATMARRRATTPSTAVITGVGVLLPQARTEQELAARWHAPDAWPIGAEEVASAQLDAVVDPRTTRRLAQVSRLALGAARLAAASAQLEGAALTESAVIVASEHGAMGYSADCYAELVRDGIDAGNPLLFAESVPNVAAGQVTIGLGLRGAALAIVGTRLAGLEALHMAVLRLREGRWRRVLVVAAEEVHPLLQTWLPRFRVVGGAPATAGDRPPLGGGAVAFAIEREGDARARGVRVRATFGEIVLKWPDDLSPWSWLRNGRDVAAGVNRASTALPGAGSTNWLRRLERRALGTASMPATPTFAELHAITPLLPLVAALGGASFDPRQPDRCDLFAADYVGGFGRAALSLTR